MVNEGLDNQSHYDGDDFEEEEEWGDDADYTEPCKYCNKEFMEDEEWEHDHECPNQDFIWMKGICPGAKTITEVREAFEHMTEFLTQKEKDGWVLTQPEDNGHIKIGKKS